LGEDVVVLVVRVATPVPVHGGDLQQIVSKINTTIAHEIDTCKALLTHEIDTNFR
jgi:hypothetical protein